jgi:tetratricopeptide (TPR) repeat protein
MGNTAEAVTTMLRVLDYCDDRAKIYRTIGSLYAREANYDTAMAYFKKAVDDNPADAESYAAMALCYLELGDTSTAVSKVNRALMLDEDSPVDPNDGRDPHDAPGSPDVLCAAAMVYDAIGEFYKASEYFEQMIATGIFAEHQCQLYTQFLFNHQVYDILIQFAEESLEVYPHSSFYCTYLAAAYFYTNRYNKVRKMLPDVSPALLSELCPELIMHPLLGPLVPADPYNNK